MLNLKLYRKIKRKGFTCMCIFIKEYNERD